MKKLSLVFTIGIIALLLIAALPLYAGTTSWSGRLENPDPSWDRVDDVDCGPAYGYIEWYDTQVFSVDTIGTYTIEMIAMTGDISPDGLFALYDTTFNPANPTGNCIATDDDSAGGLSPKLMVSLQAGRTYVLVTTQCCDGLDAGEEMNYTNQITGPGNIALTAALAAAPGNCPFPLPAGLTQGVITETTSAFWAADSTATTNVVLPVGSHWWILGTSGGYVNLWISCQGTPVWVPADTVS